MLTLVYRNLLRRPLRHGIVLAGLAITMAVLICIESLGTGYRRALARELDGAGVQMMLVPLGCPYDAAARVLKNQSLENSLPGSALDSVRADQDVAIAAPLLIAAVPREAEHRTEMWAGIDESALRLKPWWKIKSGANWFHDTNSMILGHEAAVIETRSPGDTFYSPEMKRELRVSGVLARSGTSDDSIFFVPLATAQTMFNQSGRLTAIAIRLRDPAKMREVSERLQRIPGAQVVTMTEMMGTFLNLIGAMRTLVLAIALVSVAVSALGVFNTLLAGVLERANELTVMRALGASRAQVFLLLTAEALALAILGGVLGVGLAYVGGPAVEAVAKRFVPFANGDMPFAFSIAANARTFLLVALVGMVAAIYPAWRASRLEPASATKIQ
jgi:putative ABC transport system permease protein